MASNFKNMPEKVIYKVNGSVSEIILNNPEKLNCMGFEMLRELDRVFDAIDRNDTIRAVLIRGAGERAFSTGADLKEFRTLSTIQVEEWILSGNLLFNKIASLLKPTVAFMEGYAMGGGLELALACDLRLGTVRTVISSPELQHGWLPGWGGMTRLRNLLGEAKAKEVVMLNERIPANEALRLGLITRILNEGGEKEEMEALLEHLSCLNQAAFRLAKAALMDRSRTTDGPDIQFDILAMKINNEEE
jgi:enoyl-CoA hydratase/carnithine racemase